MASVKKPIILAKPIPNSKPAITSLTKATPVAARKPFALKKTPIKPESTTVVTTKIEKPTNTARPAKPSASVKPSAATKPIIVKRIPDSTTKLTVGATVKPAASSVKSAVTVASSGRAVAAKSAPKPPISPSGATKLRMSPAETAVKSALAAQAVDVRTKLVSPARTAPPKFSGSAVEARSSRPAVTKPKPALAVKSTTAMVSPVAAKLSVISSVVKSTVSKPTITSKTTSAASKALAAKLTTATRPAGRAVAALKSIRTRPSNAGSSCVARIQDIVEVRDADSTTVDVSMGKSCDSLTAPTSLCLCEPSEPQFDEERAYVVAEQILSVIAAATEDAAVDVCPAAANESCIVDMTLVDVTFDERSNAADGDGNTLAELSAKLAVPEMSSETDEATDRCEVEGTGDAEPADAGEVVVAEAQEAAESVCDDDVDIEIIEDGSIAADCPLETAVCEDEVETTTEVESEDMPCGSCELITNHATSNDFGELSRSSAEQCGCSDIVEADEQTDELNKALIDHSCKANLDGQTVADVAAYSSVDDSCEENRDDRGTENSNETNEVSADDYNCQTNTSDVGELARCEPIPDYLISEAVDEPKEMLAHDNKAYIDCYVSEGIEEPTEDCDTTTDEGVESIEDSDPAGEENSLSVDDANVANIRNLVSKDADESIDVPVHGSDEAHANDSVMAVRGDTCETVPENDDCASNALLGVTDLVEDPAGSTAEAENLATLRGSKVSAGDAGTAVQNDESEIGKYEVGFDDDTIEAGDRRTDANKSHLMRSEKTSAIVDGFLMVLEIDEAEDVMSAVSAESTSYAGATGSSKASQQSDRCDQEYSLETRTADSAAEFGTLDGKYVESHLSEGPSEKHYGDENVELTDRLDEEVFRKIRQRKNRKRTKKSERKTLAKNKELEWTAANKVNDEYFEQQYNRRKNPRKWRKPKTIFNAPHWKYYPDES